MACWRYSGPGRWYDDGTDKAERSARRRHRRGRKTRPSGNLAFDEYRDETLRRLEDDQQAFQDFLERLRHAKDKAEFDQFMADRRDRSQDAGNGNGPEGPSPAASS